MVLGRGAFKTVFRAFDEGKLGAVPGPMGALADSCSPDTDGCRRMCYSSNIVFGSRGPPYGACEGFADCADICHNSVASPAEEGIEVAWNQIKVNDLASSPAERERLWAEIRVLKQLKHKNVSPAAWLLRVARS